jgi:isopentenyl-diphosphate delta-isomerase
MTEDEQVVLVDETGKAIGCASKMDVHHRATPLHLGFSCYLFNPEGQVLLTRRALAKVTWPGVWTNSFCGHPAPGEPIVEAVRRRAREELGVAVDEPVCVLPDFRYQAVAADGTLENEICPVFYARTGAEVIAAPTEVMETRWVSWQELRLRRPVAVDDQSLGGDPNPAPEGRGPADKGGVGRSLLTSLTA